MTYAMSDIHGCYDKYIAMLEKIQLKDDDTLIVLGDVIDRGEDGIKILLDMMDRPNIRPFLGNHEMMMYLYIKEMQKPIEDRDETLIRDLFFNWIDCNGGRVTYSAFEKLNENDQDRVCCYLADFDVYDELSIAGKNYFISHAGLSHFAERKSFEEYTLSDFVEGRMDYDRVYFPNKIILSGHTPTLVIGEQYKGKIYRKNNHIVLDCGIVFGNPLGCICLDTMEEFYV